MSARPEAAEALAAIREINARIEAENAEPHGLARIWTAVTELYKSPNT